MVSCYQSSLRPVAPSNNEFTKQPPTVQASLNQPHHYDHRLKLSPSLFTVEDKMKTNRQSQTEKESTTVLRKQTRLGPQHIQAYKISHLLWQITINILTLIAS
ncbi:hypothetical protein Bca101_081792 [Brassica carinata]